MNKTLTKILSFFLIITIMIYPVFLVNMTVSAETIEFAGGTGSEIDPYLIETKEQLNNVRYNLDAHYKLIADIVYTDDDFAEGGFFYNNGKGWNPIGSDVKNIFTGSFNGSNYTIYNLYINITLQDVLYCGLFGITRDADFNNVILVDSNITANGNYSCVGGIVGYAVSTDFNACTNSGIIKSSDDAGGIVGYVQGGSINNCHNFGEVISTNCAGGIVGATDVDVSICNNSGNVLSYKGNTAGGIVGYLYRSGKINQCYNLGNISADDCSSNTHAGGICGISDGVIDNCFNTGNIYANDSSDYAFAGGIAGKGSVYNCYNTGMVSSDASTTYYTNAGGIAGDFDTATTNCYYSNINDEGVGRGTDSAVKCSNEELSNKDTFIGYDFDTIWEFIEDNAYPYPTLKNNNYFLESENNDNQCINHIGGVATCKEQAVCDICGTKYGDIDKNNHVSLDEIIENEIKVTCDDNGSYELVVYCNLCGLLVKKEIITIPASGHDIIINDAVAPDCTNTGLTAGEHCSRCDYKIEQTAVDALGHKYESVVTAPTCTTQGFTTYTCHCGDTYTSDYVDAVAHNYKDGICIDCETPDLSYFTFEIQQPSRTTIRCNDGIKLHAKIMGNLPDGSRIEWTKNNNNFNMTTSASGNEITIISKNNGYTTFTATVYDTDNNVIAQDTVEMYSKAGFFDKIGGFFRSLFGSTKIYDN